MKLLVESVLVEKTPDGDTNECYLLLLLQLQIWEDRQRDVVEIETEWLIRHETSPLTRANAIENPLEASVVTATCSQLVVGTVARYDLPD